MSFLKPTPPTIAQPVVPDPPPPVLAPEGSKPGSKPGTKTFLGGGDTANQSGNTMGKTLLGA